jgi:hypothetical protein
MEIERLYGLKSRKNYQEELDGVYNQLKEKIESVDLGDLVAAVMDSDEDFCQFRQPQIKEFIKSLHSALEEAALDQAVTIARMQDAVDKFKGECNGSTQ